MCVTFIALQSPEPKCRLGNESQQTRSEQYKVILLNNRDEQFNRPTSGLHWEEGTLAGRDEAIEARGTWLAMSPTGRIGNLLAIEEAPDATNAAESPHPSRGRIALDFLKSELPLDRFMTDLSAEARHHPAFQFVGLERDSVGEYHMMSIANRVQTEPIVWKSGCYGFGNSTPNIPFRKVTWGEKIFSHIVVEFTDEEQIVKKLFKFAQSRDAHYPDSQLKSQTVGSFSHEDDYRHLTSLFVRNVSHSNHGTRSQSVILVDADDQVTFYERRLVGSPYFGEIADEDWRTEVTNFRLT